MRPATLASNLSAFRRIVASIAKIDATKGRFARCGDGRREWLAAVEAVPLEKVTPAAVEAWKLAFVSNRSANDENKARSARITANATLRFAKSLFSKRLLHFIAPKIELPSPLPFDGVEFFPRQTGSGPQRDAAATQEYQESHPADEHGAARLWDRCCASSQGPFFKTS